MVHAYSVDLLCLYLFVQVFSGPQFRDVERLQFHAFGVSIVKPNMNNLKQLLIMKQQVRMLLTLLVVSFCAVQSAWARVAPTFPTPQTLESGKTYYLYNVGSDRFLYYDGSVNAYKAAEPWSGFKDVVSMAVSKYTLTYKVDGEVYKTYELLEGAAITPEAEPTKAGYEFSGWSTIPQTMPAEDVTITGTFSLAPEKDAITIKETGKTTYCSDYDLEFPDGDEVKAFIATGYDSNKGIIWLTRIYSVPAGTGLVVKGVPGTHSINRVSSGSVYANFLKGVTQASVTVQAVEDNMKTFVMSGGSFMPISGEMTLPKGKAYLALPNNLFAGTRSVSLGFVNEDGTTSIDGTAEIQSQNDNVYYNLHGQRIDSPSKGLYIKNGKKVIVR